jgi:hypothetical protein
MSKHIDRRRELSLVARHIDFGNLEPTVSLSSGENRPGFA